MAIAAHVGEGAPTAELVERARAAERSTVPGALAAFAGRRRRICTIPAHAADSCAR